VRQVEDKLCFAENGLDLVVNTCAIVFRSGNNALKLCIKLSRIVDERVDVSRLAARSGVYQEMQRAIVVRRQRIQEMVPTAQITQRTFIGAQSFGHGVPTDKVEIVRRHAGPHKSHPAATVGHGKSPPVGLTRQNCGACWKRRLAGTGIWQKDKAFRREAAGNPGMQPPDGL
jgi:hypothetical protein